MTRICLIAGNFDEALTWANGHHLSPDQWFYPTHMNDLLFLSNFHVIVCGTAGQNVSPAYFEKLYALAQERGRVGRH